MCLPPSAPMVMNVSIFPTGEFIFEGFSCKGTGIDNYFRCESCPVGTYGSINQIDLCKACPKGKYSFNTLLRIIVFYILNIVCT